MSLSELSKGVGELASAFAELVGTAKDLAVFVFQAPEKIWNSVKEVYKDVKKGGGDAYDRLTRPRPPRSDLDIYSRITKPPSFKTPHEGQTWEQRARIIELDKAINAIESHESYMKPHLEILQLELAMQNVKDIQGSAWQRRKSLIKLAAQKRRDAHRMGHEPGDGESTINLSEGAYDEDGRSLEQIEAEIQELEEPLGMVHDWPEFELVNGTLKPIPNSKKPTNLIGRRNFLQRDPAYKAAAQKLAVYKYEKAANKWEIDKLKEDPAFDLGH